MARRNIPHKRGDDNEMLKWCNHCKRWLPLYHFSKNSKAWDKLECMCKECTAEKNMRFIQRNPDYNKEYNRIHKEEIKERRKKKDNLRKLEGEIEQNQE